MKRCFFGRDMLKMKFDEGRVYLNHNRDIGMLAHDRLVVLGLMETVEFYQGNPKVVDMNARLTQVRRRPIARSKRMPQASIYQVADDLYTHLRYRIDGEPLMNPKVDMDKWDRCRTG